MGDLGLKVGLSAEEFGGQAVHGQRAFGSESRSGLT